MKNARFKQRQAWPATALSLMCGGVWLAMLTNLPLCAADNSAPPPSAGTTQSVQLDYREFDFPVGRWGLPVSPQSGPFKKEPGFGLRKVVRGTLNFGNNPDQYVPFIWDHAGGKLYLDLNRNRDLTDDPGGVCSCEESARSSPSYQTFTNIHLTFKTPKGAYPARVDLSLYNYNQTFVTVVPRCGWAGKVSLQGRDWQVGVIENYLGPARHSGQRVPAPASVGGPQRAFRPAKRLAGRLQHLPQPVFRPKGLSPGLRLRPGRRRAALPG